MPNVPEKYLIEREGPDGTQWYAEDAPGCWTSNWRQADLFDSARDAYDVKVWYGDCFLRDLSNVEAEQKVNP